ncbi:ESX-1 secretion-associated protein EspI isoform X5 [Calliphora vicina]|uniref:ESX-1 secretion-associated protein EspI isoform X5 n=1 Tax=Calliphora vicina TaxID=7373 RepID=UPI00325C032C
MDGFIIGISIGLSIFVVTSAVVLIRRRKRNTRYPGEVITAPVVVTSATHTAPGGYPVTQMPVGATTTAYQTQVYATPYPPQGAPTHMPMPMPMAGGQPPAGVQPPYPPYPTMSAASMNPPSYDVAVSGAGAGQPNNAASYQKQAPYNPSYQM